MDPLKLGNDQAILSILRAYPLPNDPTLGDGYNTSGYRFAANQKANFNTSIARIDYNITSDGRHIVFWRGNLQSDSQGGAPQFPGQPSSTTFLNNSRGFAAGYTAVLAPNKVNTFRWVSLLTDSSGILSSRICSSTSQVELQMSIYLSMSMNPGDSRKILPNARNLTLSCIRQQNACAF